MKIVKQETKKEKKRYANPYGYATGELDYVEVEENETYTTVQLNEDEYKKLNEILILNPKQYRKFKKKFFKT